MTLAFACVYACLAALLTANAVISRRRSKKTDASEVRLSPVALVVGIAGLAVFSAFTLISCQKGASIAVCLIFFAFSLGGAFLIAAYLNCRVYYGANGFEVAGVFGRRRAYKYDEVTSVELLPRGEAVVRLKKRAIRLDVMTDGADGFVKRLDDAGIAVQTPFGREKRRFDLFNGNVADETGFLVVIAVMTAIGIAMAVLCGVGLTKNRVTPQDALVCAEVRFDRYESGDGSLRLFAGDTEYRVSDIDALSDRAALISGVDRGVTFRVGYAPDAKSNKLYEIADADGSAILVYDDAARQISQSRRGMIVALAVIESTVIFILGGTVAVGRHPDKFPEFVRRAFFKKGYLSTDCEPGKRR